MYTTKTQEEWLIMKLFREQYPYFPKGKLHKSESPDFILKQSLSKSFGIELTRLRKNKASGSKETEYRSILHHAEDQYKQHFKQPLYVQVFFRGFSGTLLNAELFATKLSITVIDALSGQNMKAQKQFAIPESELPEEIKRIVIYSDPAIKTSVWEFCTELSIDDIMNSSLVHDAVVRKEEKLDLYRKQIHDFYWLILYVNYLDYPRSFNIEKVLSQLRLSTKFHHVFFFNVFDQKYYEVN